MRTFQPRPASRTNDRPDASHSAWYSAGSGPNSHSAGPRWPRHHSICNQELATARPSRTTWMNFEPVRIASMKPARGQPVNLCTKAAHSWDRARVSKTFRNRPANQGVTSEAVRSRNGSDSSGETSRSSSR